jgi:sugar/nucleoside kinase (ribokinase family)
MLGKYVNIVFANEEEARSLTGKEPAEALEEMMAMCEVAVVKVGREGSLVGSGQLAVGSWQLAVGSWQYRIGAIPVKSIDTTGAGDLYASGFLYGIVNGYPLEKCGKIGAILAGKVIEVIGPKIDEEGWKVVRKMV